MINIEVHLFSGAAIKLTIDEAKDLQRALNELFEGKPRKRRRERQEATE